MNPSSVMRLRVNCERERKYPDSSRTSPSGASWIGGRLYVPGAGGVNASGAGGSGACAAAHREKTTPAAAQAPRRIARLIPPRRAHRRLQPGRAELHMVRASQLLAGEVDLESRLEPPSVPGQSAQDRLV